MRNTNKKGFTIVELVIVVAVIAILAAVLIPTFSSIIKKANSANDTVVAKNMNTALAEYSALNGKPETFDEVLAAIEEAGYVLANLNAKAQGNLYGWDKTNNQIVYIDAEGKTIYQNVDFVAADLKIVVANSDVKVPSGFGTLVDMSKPEGEKALQGALEAGIDVTLTTDLTGADAIIVPSKQEVTIDLGGKTITTGERNSWDHQYALNVYGTVTLTNGKIDARGVEVRDGGKLIIGEGVEITAVDDNGGAAVYLYKGAEVEINGGTFKATAAKDSLNGGSVILNNGGKLTINGGTFISTVDGPYVVNHHGGETIINGGTFEGARGVVGAQVSGTVTINGGTFTKTNADFPGYEMYCQTGATLIINGGTFTEDPHNNGGTITDNR